MNNQYDEDLKLKCVGYVHIKILRGGYLSDVLNEAQEKFGPNKKEIRKWYNGKNVL